jgi:DNA/RNA-binding domain of Phe-tRNA-synthetase-like protein
MSINLTIADEIKNKIPGFALGAIEYRDIVISKTPKMIKGKINLFLADLRLGFGSVGLTQIPGIQEWRKCFKSIGIDPSKYRPSSESLLKRALQEKPMYWIHSAVDLNNYFSMKYALPFGIYHANKIEGDIQLRIGRPGESYMGLNGRETSMDGKLVLADSHSPFGSPIVDSVRTSVTEEAQHIIQLLFMYPELISEQRSSILDDTASTFIHIHGGTVATKEVLT